MNVVQVTYSLVYRLKKDSLIYLYQNMSTNYEDRIVATVNVSKFIFRELFPIIFLPLLKNKPESQFKMI